MNLYFILGAIYHSASAHQLSLSLLYSWRKSFFPFFQLQLVVSFKIHWNKVWVFILDQNYSRQALYFQSTGRSPTSSYLIAFWKKAWFLPMLDPMVKVTHANPSPLWGLFTHVCIHETWLALLHFNWTWLCHNHILRMLSNILTYS